MPRRRSFVMGQIYYGVHADSADMKQCAVVSFKYTGQTDDDGRHIFAILGAPPEAKMVLEKRGEDSLRDLHGLIKELRRHAS